MSETLLSPWQVASMIGVHPQTLQKWRTAGKGPQFIDAGWMIRYRKSDVLAWLAMRNRQMTRSPAEKRAGIVKLPKTPVSQPVKLAPRQPLTLIEIETAI